MSFYTESFGYRDLIQAQDIAVRAAEDVSSALQSNFGKAKYSEKAPDDWVTDWDKWAQDEIMSGLRKFSSSIPIVGEENGLDKIPEDAEDYWTVDPIDGTKLFVRGVEGCSTMISLVSNDVPVVGVIYDFVNKRPYTAVTNSYKDSEGSFQDGNKRLHVSNRLIENSRIETYASNGLRKDINKRLRAIGANVIHRSCTGLTLTDIAKGETEGFISLDNPYRAVWDVAPGALLVAMAGGHVRNIGKEDFRLSDPNFIASNRRCAPILEEVAGQHVGATQLFV